MGTKSAKNKPNKPSKTPRVVKPAPLPLPEQASSLAPTATTPSAKRDKNNLPKDGLVRKKALAIVALRLEGLSNEEIAARLDIKPKSVNQYIYLAGRNGWLVKRDGTLADPHDDVEANIVPRVIRNLSELLDSDDEAVRKEVTLKTAAGTVFQKFSGEAAAAQPSQLANLSINIVMPPGGSAPVRPGTTNGTPMFIDGQVVQALPPGSTE